MENEELNYKGINYNINWWDENPIKYIIDNKEFEKKEDLFRYIDKVVLRKNKLERLKIIN